jgi:hypothetical protein
MGVFPIVITTVQPTPNIASWSSMLGDSYTTSLHLGSDSVRYLSSRSTGLQYFEVSSYNISFSSSNRATRNVSE